MSLFSSLRGAKAVTYLSDAYQMTWDSASNSGVTVSNDTALGIVAVYACVRVLAESVASLPLIVYRRRPDGGKERYLDHPLFGLLHDQPNDYMTSFVFREVGMNHVATWGNTYSEIERLTGFGSPIIALHPLRPDLMRVAWDGTAKRYFYMANGREVELPARKVFHVPGMGYDGLIGYNPIRLHREALGLYKAAETFGSSTFRNNARPATVIQHPKTMTTGAIDRLAAQMEQLRGSANAGRSVILEEGAEVKEIGIPPADAQYIETRKFQLQEIARMFRVPPHKIGDLDRATFSNIEHQSIEFVVDTLRPWLVRWEQQIKAQLLPDEPDVYVEFLVDGLLRGDSAARAAALNIQRNAGVINADEWRAMENMNPLPDGQGNDYWRPLNMSPSGEPPNPPGGI